MEVKHSEMVNGLGLFSKSQYKKGEIIFILNGSIKNKPSRESIYIGENKHITDKWGTFMNHSFSPTTLIKGRNVVALINIDVGDELTFNYNDNEINMACPFSVGDILVCGKKD